MFSKMFSKILYKEMSKYVDAKAKQRRMNERLDAQRRLDEEERQKEERILNERKIEFADKVRIADSYLREVVDLEQLIYNKMDKIHEHFKRVWLSKNSIEKEHHRFPPSYDYIFLTTPQFTELLNKLEILQQYQKAAYLSVPQIKTLLFILQNTEVIEPINKKLAELNYKIGEAKLGGPTLFFPISMISYKK